MAESSSTLLERRLVIHEYIRTHPMTTVKGIYEGLDIEPALVRECVRRLVVYRQIRMVRKGEHRYYEVIA